VRELKGDAEARASHFDAVSQEEARRIAAVAFRLLIGREAES
jgi:hypothetical protein